jgi:hypothetical protein
MPSFSLDFFADSLLFLALESATHDSGSVPHTFGSLFLSKVLGSCAEKLSKSYSSPQCRIRKLIYTRIQDFTRTSS